jgi:hypothetical protein
VRPVISEAREGEHTAGDELPMMWALVNVGAHRNQSIDVGRLDVRVAQCANGVGLLVIGEQEQHIRLLDLRRCDQVGEAAHCNGGGGGFEKRASIKVLHGLSVGNGRGGQSNDKTTPCRPFFRVRPDVLQLGILLEATVQTKQQHDRSAT